MIKVGWFYPPHILGLGHEVMFRSVERALVRNQVDATITKFDITADPIAVRAFDLVLVDIDLPSFKEWFWRNGETWTLLRWMPTYWCKNAFDCRDKKSRVIAIEPIVPYNCDVAIEPLVYCNRDEMAPPPHPYLRQRALVLHSDPDEIASLPTSSIPHGMIVDKVSSKFGLFPFTKQLYKYNRIVSGAGYCRFWETQWLGLADRTALYAMGGRRFINDQPPRLELATGHTPTQNGADQLALMIGAQ